MEEEDEEEEDGTGTLYCVSSAMPDNEPIL
jgi:hypothetical protein